MRNSLRETLLATDKHTQTHTDRQTKTERQTDREIEADWRLDSRAAGFSSAGAADPGAAFRAAYNIRVLTSTDH